MQPVTRETSKNTFHISARKDAPALTLSSDFDSGNMARAELAFNSIIVITPAFDCANHNISSHAKGWFHFTVTGAASKLRQKFIIKQMSQLSCNVKFSEYFKPVSRVEGQSWERVEQAMVFTKQDDTELHFDYVFSSSAKVFFAYSFPFSFQECQTILRVMAKQARSIKGIYYKDEVMIRSTQGRPIHLLTISSLQHKLDQREENIHQRLFTQGIKRPFAFNSSKKIIIISSRVHPGQTPASHTFNGLLKFLLSADARARILLKNFVFKLVPMLNPDGVAQGHYRMDVHGNNLNRFYQNADPDVHPSVFAVCQLGQYYQSLGNLCFYMDLHSHPQKKGNFIYGNAIEAPKLQIQTQLFAKLLSLNCPEFDFKASSFSKQHMDMKDKNEDLTKQGCGRVVFHTRFGMLYSYTLECGYTCGGPLNQLVPIQNGHRMFDKMPIVHDQLQNLKSKYYSSQKSQYFTIRSYQNLGKNIAVSILDLFSLNPASRVPNTAFKNLDGIRKEVAFHIMKVGATYRDKVIRSQPLIRQNRMQVIKKEEKPSGNQERNISVTAKEIGAGKVRNRTVAKVTLRLY